MKTLYYTASSLDGFIADPQHSLEWLFQFGPAAGKSYESFIQGVGALAMGASTYEWLRRNLGENPWPYSMPSWVFTHRSLPIVTGADVRLVQGDVRPVHAAMAEAAAGRNLWVVGGGGLAAQFYEAGLLDELVITLAPVTLGAGAPLFPKRIDPPLRLLSAVATPPPFVELRYAVERRPGP